MKKRNLVLIIALLMTLLLCACSKKTETTEIPLKIRFAGNEQYACNQKLEFPDAGVTVENVFMTVTPMWCVAQ